MAGAVALTLGIKTKLDTSELDKLTGDLERRAKDLRAPFRGPITVATTNFLRKQFDTEGQEGGEPWEPLRPLTLKLRKRPGHGRGGIGRDTNRMWAAWTKPGAPGSVLVVRKQEMLRGVSLEHARYFQEGVSPQRQRVFGVKPKQPRGQPPRKVVPDVLPSKLTNEYERIIADYMERGR